MQHKPCYTETCNSRDGTIKIPDDTTEVIADNDPISKRRYINRYQILSESVNNYDLYLLS